MTEELYANDPVKRAEKLEMIMTMILNDPENSIKDGHRIVAEVALYGLEEAVARRLK